MPSPRSSPWPTPPFTSPRLPRGHLLHVLDLPTYRLVVAAHRLATPCCPLAPVHHSASGLAINICVVLVEEGGPRVEAKRRGGDPLPRCQLQSQISGASGQQGVRLGARLIDEYPRRAPSGGCPVHIRTADRTSERTPPAWAGARRSDSRCQHRQSSIPGGEAPRGARDGAQLRPCWPAYEATA